MSKFKAYLKSECFKRTWRTFVQTALGYIVTNISLQLGGIDFADGNMFVDAVAGLVMSAVAAGVAAVMNIKGGVKSG